MKTIVLAVLANVSGLAIAALALVFLSGARWNWRTVIRSHRKRGLLSCVMAGCLLSVGGQLLLVRRLDTETLLQARMHAALSEPIEALSVQIHGPDPFRTVPEVCVLRLIATTGAGRTVTSEIPRSRLSLSVRAAKPGTALRDSREYTVLWQSVIEGATNEESRAVTSRIHSLNDWRLFDRIDAAIVLRSEKHIPLPYSLQIATITDPPRELFDGAGTGDEVVQQEREWVCAYNQPEWPRLADRLAGWKALETYRGPRRDPDLVESVPLGAGALCLAVGIGLMLRRAVPGPMDSRRRAPTKPPTKQPSAVQKHREAHRRARPRPRISPSCPRCWCGGPGPGCWSPHSGSSHVTAATIPGPMIGGFSLTCWVESQSPGAFSGQR